MGWSETIVVDGHTVFVCSRGGRADPAHESGCRTGETGAYHSNGPTTYK